MTPGELVGGYTLSRHVGEGPFGVVWLARAPSGGTVALKLLRAGFMERPEGQAAFVRLAASAQVHGRLQHPNLPRIHGPIQERERRLFGLAMDYLEGQTLAETPVHASVQYGQDLRNLAVVLSWFEELGAVLSWLHSQRIVHGNVKPTNVMLVRDGPRSVVKLLDLSWAAIGIAAPSPLSQWALAPEQMRGQPPTTLSDQWAVASMFTRMITGGQPNLSLGVLPQVLVMAVQRAHADAPQQRYPHMSEFVSALRAIRMEIEQRARDTTPKQPKSDGRGTVSVEDFDDEPATVRQQNLLASGAPTPDVGTPAARRLPDRYDTPMITEPDFGQGSGKRDLPLVPEARSISGEESGHLARPAPRIPDGAPIDETSGPKQRYDVGDPFTEPLVPEDFGRVPSTITSGPSVGPIEIPIDEPDPVISADVGDDRPGPTLPSALSSRAGSRLAAIGVVFMVIAAMIAVAALTILGEETAPDAKTGKGGRVAAQLDDEKPAVPVDAPTIDPPVPVESPPPPPPSEPPPVASDAVPAKVVPKKAKPGIEKVERAEKKPPKGSPEIADLDAKADQALEKLLAGGDGARSASDPEVDAQVACDEGDGDACVTLGRELERSSAGRARDAFERACSFGKGEGCHRAAKLYGGAKGETMERRACELGRAESCPRADTSSTT